MRDKIKSIVNDKQVFIVFDETLINGSQYAHFLIGMIDDPGTTYLAECVVLEKSLNSNKVCMLIDDTLRNYNIQRENFVLLLSDAARYMTSAGKDLKKFYPNLFMFFV